MKGYNPSRLLSSHLFCLALTTLTVILMRNMSRYNCYGKTINYFLDINDLKLWKKLMDLPKRDVQNTVYKNMLKTHWKEENQLKISITKLDEENEIREVDLTLKYRYIEINELFTVQDTHTHARANEW